MALTYLARIRAEKIARIEAEASAAGDESTASGSEYEMTLIRLNGHRKQLSAVKSRVRKVELKRKLLPDYEPYVSGVLASGSGVQDEVLVTLMVWRIDIGDHDGALDIADYALRHGFVMPERFRRDVATLIAEEIADALLATQASDDTRAVMTRTLDLTQSHDMPDEVRAKLNKAAGLAWETIDRQKALDHYKRALELNPRVGVKTVLRKLEEAAPDEGGAT